jgi:hypothetical protein
MADAESMEGLYGLKDLPLKNGKPPVIRSGGFHVSAFK